MNYNDDMNYTLICWLHHEITGADTNQENLNGCLMIVLVKFLAFLDTGKEMN